MYHRVRVLEWFGWKGSLKMLQFQPPAIDREPSSLLRLVTELLLKLLIPLLTV